MLLTILGKPAEDITPSFCNSPIKESILEIKLSGLIPFLLVALLCKYLNKFSFTCSLFSSYYPYQFYLLQMY